MKKLKAICCFYCKHYEQGPRDESSEKLIADSICHEHRYKFTDVMNFSSIFNRCEDFKEIEK